jgi:hypothetical protein
MIAIAKLEEPWTQLLEENPKAVMLEGYDDAYIGYTVNEHNNAVAVYDLAACVQILRSEDLAMTPEEAEEEFLQFHIAPRDPELLANIQHTFLIMRRA